MAVDIPEILNDTSRANIRKELIVMAFDIRCHISRLENELSSMRRRHADAVRRGTFMIVPYQLEISRLEAAIQRHQATQGRVKELAEMTKVASAYELTHGIRSLQLHVAPWLLLNPGRLPWKIRRRLRNAELQLA